MALSTSSPPRAARIAGSVQRRHGNVRPMVEVKSAASAGPTTRFREVRPARRAALGHALAGESARKRSEKSMGQRLAAEMLEASENRGGAVKKHRRSASHGRSQQGLRPLPLLTSTRRSFFIFEGYQRHVKPYRALPQYRYQRPHRRRQDDDDRAHPVLHRPITRSAKSTTARHHGLDGAGQERGITITSAATTCFWKGMGNNFPRASHQHHRHPGPRGLHHRGRALHARARTAPCMVYCAVGGVQPSPKPSGVRPTSTTCPHLAFVNKMDRPGANFFKVRRPDEGPALAQPGADGAPSAPRYLRGRRRSGQDEGHRLGPRHPRG